MGAKSRPRYSLPIRVQPHWKAVPTSRLPGQQPSNQKAAVWPGCSPEQRTAVGTGVWDLRHSGDESQGLSHMTPLNYPSTPGAQPAWSCVHVCVGAAWQVEHATVRVG